MLHSRRDRDRAGGQIIVLFALVLVVILATAAIVIDLGLLRNNRQTLVNAMDAGALAGGTLLPVDGANPGDVDEIEDLIDQTVQATYAGLTNPDDYQITYRCLIGVAGSPPQAAISRDIPLVCDPSNALGHSPVNSDFIGAGPTRSSICDPGLGDRCNAVEVAGAVTTGYSFGQAVGVESGSTGVVRAAACNGPCGEPPLTPVDLVLVIDRTNSMTGDENNLRDAANAVLQAYDPEFQHVALGILGPSTLDSDCSGSPSDVHAIPLVRQTTSPPAVESDANDATPATGAGSLSVSKPSGTSVGDVLVAGIAVDGGNTASITPPSGAGGWTEIRRTDKNGDIGLASYYKVATTADEGISSYSFEISPDGRAAGGIIRFSGVDTDDPIDGSSGNTNEGVGVAAQGFTTSADNTALVGFFATDTGTTFGDADSMTERFDTQSGDDGGEGPTISGNTDTQGGNGGTGDREAIAGADAPWAAQLVALRPAPAVQSYGTDPEDEDDLRKWVPVGLTGTVWEGQRPPVEEAYVVNGVLQPSTSIVKAIDCFELSGTGTNLATPMAMARRYLDEHGRTGVKQGIILETDGAPNYNGWTGDPENYTCAQAQTEAQLAKDADIEIFTIGFDVGGQSCPDGAGSTINLLGEMATGPIIGGSQCNQAENSDGDHFFCEPAGSELSAVFQAAAAELADLRSHLVQIYPPPIVAAVGPAGGSPNGGTTVTITGQNFTGATSVRFGGAPASFTVLSDTAIQATAPGGESGTTVDIRVATPGGSSPITAADRYTYD